MNKIIIFFIAAITLFMISCKITKCDTNIQTALNEQCVEAGHVRGYIEYAPIFGNLYYCVREDASLMIAAEPIRNCK